MKKFMKLVFALVLMFGLAACSSSSDTKSYDSTTPVVVGEKKGDEEPVKATMTVDVTTLINDKNKDKVKEEVTKYIPEDGYILKDLPLELYGNPNLKDILEKVGEEKGIKIDWGNSSFGDYVSGIGNVTEKQIGDTDGWMYTVNGEYPNYSIDKTNPKQGDKISFIYSIYEEK